MSEEQVPYTVMPQETQEAMDMPGKGYEHPSVVIEPPHAVVERRGNEFKEVITPAFVKISTDFKQEMAAIDEISLKVWLFIALSVNRYSGKANPGLRAIAKGTGFAINTIQAALKRLENEYNLLTVDRESRKYNIYEPLAFVSANRIPPTSGVSPDDTAIETVSVEDESVSVGSQSVSVEGESVSPRVILNQINQSNQIKPDITKPDFVNLTVTQAAALPELRLFREATGSIPGQGQWEVVWQTIRDMRAEKKPVTADKLRPFFLSWTSRGYNPRSLNWLTEWARSGVIPENGHRTTAEVDPPRKIDPVTGRREIHIPAPATRKNDFITVDLDKPLLPQLEKSNQ